jgi:D-tyrosyl-tRNA(Tyr) deacylase
MLVLVGVEKDDGRDQVAKAAEKLAHLRLFEDAQGRMNLDAAAVGGALLVVSQFTLAGSLEKGRRPSFDGAAPGERAEPLVEELVDQLRELGCVVETGRFGARMEVELINDGPVTFVLDLTPASAAG